VLDASGHISLEGRPLFMGQLLQARARQKGPMPRHRQQTHVYGNALQGCGVNCGWPLQASTGTLKVRELRGILSPSTFWLVTSDWTTDSPVAASAYTCTCQSFQHHVALFVSTHFSTFFCTLPATSADLHRQRNTHISRSVAVPTPLRAAAESQL